MSRQSKHQLLAVLNAAVVAGVIFWNYWTAANGFAGSDIREQSDRYGSLFTPASYAFSIWGLIFLGQVVHAGYQLKLAFRGDDTHLFSQLGPWLVLTNVANGLWTVLWLSDLIAMSVLILGAMNVFLVVAMYRLRMAVVEVSRSTRAFVWWPIQLYAGWVAVAALANVSAWSVKAGLGTETSETWAVGLAFIALLYNLAVLVARNLRLHAAVGIWSLVAIAAPTLNDYFLVDGTALGGAVVLVVFILHSFRKQSPVKDDSPA